MDAGPGWILMSPPWILGWILVFALWVDFAGVCWWILKIQKKRPPVALMDFNVPFWILQDNVVHGF